MAAPTGVVEREQAAWPALTAHSPLVMSERRLVLLLADLLAITISLFLALASEARSPIARLEDEPWLRWVALLWFVWAVAAAVFDCYSLRSAAHATQSVLAAYRAAVATFFVYLLVPYLSAPLLTSRLAVGIWVVSSLALLGLPRLLYAKLLTQPRFMRRVAVIGGGQSAQAIVETLQREAPTEYVVAGVVVDNITDRSPVQGVPVLGTHADLLGTLEAHGIREVVIAQEDGLAPDVAASVVDLYQSGVEVRLMSDLYEEITGRIPVKYIKAHWFAVLPRSAGGGRAYELAKRTFDVVVAAILLGALLPVLGVVALAIRLDSPGPVLYRQLRTGYLGRRYDIWKFRTMVDGAEQGDAIWATRDDPRRTRVGRLLRRTHVDELPQFVNVLLGDMSLIGPRPERPEFVADLERAIPFYRTRLLVRPGITGWAQVRAPYSGSVEGSLEKLQYDLYYVKHRSAYLDLVIALKTVGAVVGARGH